MGRASRARASLAALAALAALSAPRAARADAADSADSADYSIDDLIMMGSQDYQTFGTDDYAGTFGLDYGYGLDDFGDFNGAARISDDPFTYYGDEIDEYYDTYGFYADEGGGRGDYTGDDYFFAGDAEAVGDCTVVDGKPHVDGARAVVHIAHDAGQAS